MPRSFQWLYLPFLVFLLWGCAPSLSPLYRDYEAPTGPETAVKDSIRAALQEAGWTLVSSSPPNAIATQPRLLSNWWIYKTRASLEVLPLGQKHVRLYIHPYRTYFTGGQSKIAYLSSGLREELLPDINEALQEKGLTLVGTPFQRDNTGLHR